MPTQKKNQKSVSRRVSRPRSKLTGLSSGPLIFPSRFQGVVSYSTVVQANAAGSSAGYNTFRLNSVHDPDFTNVGTSAAGLAQLYALYGRYRVLSADVELEFTNLGALPTTVFAAAGVSSSIGVSTAQIMAQRHTWMHGLGSATGTGSYNHKMHIPIGEVYGVPARQVATEDDFASVSGSNPNNVAFLNVGLLNLASGAYSTMVRIRITYNCVWSLPLELIQ